MTLLEATDLVKQFPIGGGFLAKNKRYVHAVNGVSLRVNKGETLGIVGESGCGKSTLALLLMRLLEPDSGKIIFAGEEISELNQKALRPLRARMQMVFQDPYASLNPRMQAGDIIKEPLIIHKVGKSRQREARVVELLELVGLKSSDYEKYPHEFSGGQRQRIGIARAIALNPDLIVADEPVSSLDVSIQAEIINLLKELQAKFNLTYIFISHDLKVVSQMSDKIAVMYLGKIVEKFSASELAHVKHPYTQALLNSVLIADPTKKKEGIILSGDVPSPIQLPGGCYFHPRCPYREDRCWQETPTLEPKGNADHLAACFFTNKTPKEISLG